MNPALPSRPSAEASIRQIALPVLLLLAAAITTATAVTGRFKDSVTTPAPTLAMAFCEKAGPYTLLAHDEYEDLQYLARRVGSMMGEFLPFYTHVWPHAVRDSQGRSGLILESSIPLANLAASHDQEHLKGWLVCAILAVGKYSDLPGVELDHLCFTDATAQASEARWCYDADASLVRGLHRALVKGEITAEQAHDRLVAHWKRLEVSR